MGAVRGSFRNLVYKLLIIEKQVSAAKARILACSHSEPGEVMFVGHRTRIAVGSEKVT